MIYLLGNSVSVLPSHTCSWIFNFYELWRSVGIILALLARRHMIYNLLNIFLGEAVTSQRFILMHLACMLHSTDQKCICFVFKLTFLLKVTVVYWLQIVGYRLDLNFFFEDKNLVSGWWLNLVFDSLHAGVPTPSAFLHISEALNLMFMLNMFLVS